LNSSYLLIAFQDTRQVSILQEGGEECEELRSEEKRERREEIEVIEEISCVEKTRK
jgi:hypothetical protein